MWLILAESDGLSDHADGLGSDAEALGFAACYQRDARTRRGLARQDAPQCRDNAAATTHSVRGLWRVSKKHEVKDQRMGEVCEQGKYRKYGKRRKKSAGNVIYQPKTAHNAFFLILYGTGNGRQGHVPVVW